LATRPALGRRCCPSGRRRRWHHPGCCGLPGRGPLLKLAVVLGVWQVSQAALVGTWLADLPALGAALVPRWQVAQAMVLTTSWFITGLSHCV